MMWKKIQQKRLDKLNIMITGASGFIGNHIMQALNNMGHTVTACVRNIKTGQQRWPGINIVQADFSKDHNESDWLPHLTDIDIVINAVGIIRETGNQTFAALHTQAPCALFRACKKAGIKRVIQISALGANETAFSQYHLSKRAADEYLVSLDVECAVVMPSIVYGPGAKSMDFFKAIAALPVIPLIDSGNQPVQPIHINDLCKAIVQICETGTCHKLRIEMPGPQAVTMKEIYTQLRNWFGMGKARFISVPYSMALLAGRIGGFLGNTPLTQEAIQMLRKGNTGDVAPFVNQFGFEPAGFEESLKQTPAQQSDDWQGGLFFLKPLLRISIAFLWIVTGIISAFVFPPTQSYAMLAEAGISGLWAPIMLYGAAAMDLALGVATLFAWRVSLTGFIQIFVIVLYTVIITFSQPEQWIHPFGPVSKNIPLIVATLIMITLERKR